MENNILHIIPNRAGFATYVGFAVPVRRHR